MDLDDFDSPADFLDAYGELMDRVEQAGKAAEAAQADCGRLLAQAKALLDRGESAGDLLAAAARADDEANARAAAWHELMTEFLDARSQAHLLYRAMDQARIEASN